MSTGVVSVRLSDEIKHRLDRLAEATGRPAAYYVREALTEHLADLEWAYGIVTLVEESRAGRTQPRPLGDLIEDLGLTREEILTTPDA